MRETKEFSEFDFFINPQISSVVKVDDKLLLIDNLNDGTEFGINKNIDFQRAMRDQDIPIKANFAMVLFCVEGEMRLQLNLRDITVKKNCILGVMPGSIGKLYFMSDNFKSASIFFSNTYKVTLDIRDITKSQYFVFNNPVVEIKKEKMNEFIGIYNAMHQKLSDEEFKYKLELSEAYLQVLKIYWDDCKDQYAINIPQGKQGRAKVIFNAFLNEIILHFRKERSVAFYANKLFVSPKYLSRVIKEVSGRQPSDWIRELVVLEAKALLRTEQYSVQQISDQLNFSSPSFFGRYFREAVGCSPRKYRIEI